VRILLTAACCLLASAPSLAAPSSQVPDCWHWPAMMGFAQLKNKHVLDNTTDPERATHKRIASEQIGPDLYRQVYDVHYLKSTGEDVEVVTISDASHDECSMGEVRVLQVVP